MLISLKLLKWLTTTFNKSISLSTLNILHKSSILLISSTTCLNILYLSSSNGIVVVPLKILFKSSILISLSFSTSSIKLPLWRALLKA